MRKSYPLCWGVITPRWAILQLRGGRKHLRGPDSPALGRECHCWLAVVPAQYGSPCRSLLRIGRDKG